MNKDFSVMKKEDGTAKQVNSRSIVSMTVTDELFAKVSPSELIVNDLSGTEREIIMNCLKCL